MVDAARVHVIDRARDVLVAWQQHPHTRCQYQARWPPLQQTQNGILDLRAQQSSTDDKLGAAQKTVREVR